MSMSSIFLTASAYDLTEGRGGLVVRDIYSTLPYAIANVRGIDAQGTDGTVYEVDLNARLVVLI